MNQIFYLSQTAIKDHFLQAGKEKQKYNIDVFTDNYLPSFFKNIFRLLLNYFLLLSC